MHKNDVLLSVIITVYNVAPYISKCIESVIQQTYKEIEILIIDDGSTDTSGSICDAYALNDKRIKVFHRPNQGLVSARKFGVDIADGEIITFVDGDDWIENNMYECMVAVYIRERAEVVTSGLIFDSKNETGVLLDSVAEGIYEKNAIQKEILPRIAYDIQTKQKGIIASVCNKLFNGIALKKVISGVDSQLTLGEDGAIVYTLVAQINKIVIIKQAWYHYIWRRDSMVRTYKVDTFEKLYRLRNYFVKEYSRIGLENEMNLQVEYYIKGFMRPALEYLYGLDMREITYIFPYKEVPPNSKVILYGAGKVGYSYWRCLQNEEYAEVMGWVDKNYIKLQKTGLPIVALEDVIHKEFDFVIIAINKEEIAKEVQEILLSYGIKMEKIIWKKKEEI